LVEAIARHLQPGIADEWRLAVLLHDAPEYVIGDVISPFKVVIGEVYKEVEGRLLAAVRLRFGLPAQPHPALTRLTKRADRSAAFVEATHLAGFSRQEALIISAGPSRCRKPSSTISSRHGLPRWHKRGI